MTYADILIASLAFLIGLVLREFLPGYFQKKGENLATKQDVAEITELQKAVEHRFNELIEISKQRHSLRLAALDRRLEAHQAAFSLWRELVSNTHGDKIGPVVLRCQEWWEKNCLYLEASVRDAFVRAYTAAHTHHRYTQALADSKILEENWREISNFPNVLFDAIQLPPIRHEDAERVLPDPVG